MSRQVNINATRHSEATKAAGVLLQRKCACGARTLAGGECESCRKGKDSAALQRASSSGAAHSAEAPPSVGETLQAQGRPLDDSTRSFFESRFGHDFSGVRVHTDSRAADSARDVGAHAYTVGRDVVFGAGRYAPDTSEGRRLLAHELTHVVQQRASGASVQQRFAVGPAHGAAEREADAVADAVVAGASAPRVSAARGALLQRAALSTDERFLFLGSPVEMACCDKYACEDDTNGVACPDDLKCPAGSKNKPFSKTKHKYTPHLGCDPECDKGTVPYTDTSLVVALPDERVKTAKAKQKKCGQTLTLCSNGNNVTVTVREVGERNSWEASPGVSAALKTARDFHASIYPTPTDPDMQNDPKCTGKAAPKQKQKPKAETKTERKPKAKPTKKKD